MSYKFIPVITGLLPIKIGGFLFPKASLEVMISVCSDSLYTVKYTVHFSD